MFLLPWWFLGIVAHHARAAKFRLTDGLTFVLVGLDSTRLALPAEAILHALVLSGIFVVAVPRAEAQTSLPTT